MNNLWATWRKKYIMSDKKEECVFCEKPKEPDNKSFVLYRGKHVFVIMNIYPYNNGHIMVSPLRHIPCYSELNKDELAEFSNITQQSILIVREALTPHGFNTGMNIGKAGGAGFAGHLHFHIVPRWEGDTNFMPVVGKTKVNSFDLEETYQTILPFFKKIS